MIHCSIGIQDYQNISPLIIKLDTDFLIGLKTLKCMEEADYSTTFCTMEGIDHSDCILHFMWIFISYLLDYILRFIVKTIFRDKIIIRNLLSTFCYQDD